MFQAKASFRLFAFTGLVSLAMAGGSPAWGDDAPVSFLSPQSGFTSDGSLHLQMSIAKGFYDQIGKPSSIADAWVTVTVDQCSKVYRYSIANSGQVTPMSVNPNGKSTQGYYWTLDIDLSQCQCHGQVERTHHCD